MHSLVWFPCIGDITREPYRNEKSIISLFGYVVNIISGISRPRPKVGNIDGCMYFPVIIICINVHRYLGILNLTWNGSKKIHQSRLIVKFLRIEHSVWSTISSAKDSRASNSILCPHLNRGDSRLNCLHHRSWKQHFNYRCSTILNYRKLNK